MTTLRDYKEKFGDLDSYLELLYEEYALNLIFTNNQIQVPVSLIGEKCIIHESQLNKLCNREKAEGIPSLRYLDNFGIKFKTYHEICIGLSSDQYGWFEGYNWPIDPLKFKIDSVQFVIDTMSSLMVLLTEPVYGDSDYHFDFQEFASIKMILPGVKNYKDEFSKALYYLNSHYLKPLSFYCKLKPVEFANYDPLELFSGKDPGEVFEVVKRKRNLSRKDFQKTEPLVLYNYATTVHAEQRFISYYRVLEFFMEQALITRAAELRFDCAISNEQIVNEINLRNEEDHLINLLRILFTASKRKKLINYCLYHQIITDPSFDKISGALYNFRNSIVHAKEKDSIRTKFPNPFEPMKELNNWIYLIEVFARECINKFNAK